MLTGSRSQTQAVLAALEAEGERARVVGGAVRNALIGRTGEGRRHRHDGGCRTTSCVSPRRPGFNAIPTGIDARHGDRDRRQRAFRGHDAAARHRDVRPACHRGLQHDWSADAQRRDFTINALYCDREGRCTIRSAGWRISRRGACASSATRASASARTTCASCASSASAPSTATRARRCRGARRGRSEKAGLAQLSGERIRSELLLLLAAPARTSRRCNTMRGAGLIEPLFGVPGDVDAWSSGWRRSSRRSARTRPLLRLAALAAARRDGPAVASCACRAAEARQAGGGGAPDDAFGPRRGEAIARAFIYRHGAQAFTDGALLDWARSGEGDDRSARRTRRCRSAGARRRCRYAVLTYVALGAGRASRRARRCGFRGMVDRRRLSRGPERYAPNWKSWRAASCRPAATPELRGEQAAEMASDRLAGPCICFFLRRCSATATADCCEKPSSGSPEATRRRRRPAVRSGSTCRSARRPCGRRGRRSRRTSAACRCRRRAP